MIINEIKIANLIKSRSTKLLPWAMAIKSKKINLESLILIFDNFSDCELDSALEFLKQNLDYPGFANLALAADSYRWLKRDPIDFFKVRQMSNAELLESLGV